MLVCELGFSASAKGAGPFVTDDYISMDDALILDWATGYENYEIGSDIDEEWQTPEKALGQAVGDSYDIVCLGRGGSITLTFETPIIDGEGADFAVFENSFSSTFLELAWVEVSSDGIHFFRFDNASLTPGAVGAFDEDGVDASNIFQLAGKHMQGLGTLFDLSEINNFSQYGDEYKVDLSNLDLNNIRYIKIVDIVGDGLAEDTLGNIIYDPYPTVSSAGFDLDAIGVINQGTPPTIPGDFFNDHDVDGSDVSEYAYLYDNRTYPEADLNKDEVVDSKDLRKFAENFGKTDG